MGFKLNNYVKKEEYNYEYWTKSTFWTKKVISEIEYERYIKKLVYDTKHSRSNIVYFSAPNMIIAKWIKSKYTDKLIHLFELLNEVKPEIKITIGKIRFNN